MPQQGVEHETCKIPDASCEVLTNAEVEPGSKVTTSCATVGVSAKSVLLALHHLDLPEGVKTRECLVKSCQNCCQNQRAKSYPTP